MLCHRHLKNIEYLLFVIIIMYFCVQNNIFIIHENLEIVKKNHTKKDIQKMYISTKGLINILNIEAV